MLAIHDLQKFYLQILPFTLHNNQYCFALLTKTILEHEHCSEMPLEAFIAYGTLFITVTLSYKCV